MSDFFFKPELARLELRRGYGAINARRGDTDERSDRAARSSVLPQLSRPFQLTWESVVPFFERDVLLPALQVYFGGDPGRLASIPAMTRGMDLMRPVHFSRPATLKWYLIDAADHLADVVAARAVEVIDQPESPRTWANLSRAAYQTKIAFMVGAKVLAAARQRHKGDLGTQGRYLSDFRRSFGQPLEGSVEFEVRNDIYVLTREDSCWKDGRSVDMCRTCPRRAEVGGVGLGLARSA